MKARQRIPNTLRERITPFQAIAMTSSSYLPLLFWNFPQVAVAYARYDALWAVLGIVAVGIAASCIQGLLNERFPNLFGIDWLKVVYGKAVGTIMSALYVLTYVLFLGVAIRSFAFLVHDIFWPNTPLLVLTGIMLLTACFGAYHGIEGLARIAALVVPITVVGLLSTCAAAFFQIEWFGLALRIDQPNRIASGMYYLMPLLYGMNLILMISPYYRHTRRTILIPLIAAGINSTLIIAAFVAAAALMGWELTAHVTWSLPYLFRVVHLDGFLIEKVGLSMIIVSTFYNLTFAANHLWVVSAAATRLFHQSDDWFRRYLPGVALLVGGVAACIKDGQQGMDLIARWLTPLSWVLILVVPLCTLLLAIARGIRGKEEAGEAVSDA